MHWQFTGCSQTLQGVNPGMLLLHAEAAYTVQLCFTFTCELWRSKGDHSQWTRAGHTWIFKGFSGMSKCFTSNRMQLQYLTCHTFKLTLNCEASIYFNGTYSTLHLFWKFMALLRLTDSLAVMKACWPMTGTSLSHP